MHPKRGNVYTLAQIENELELSDTPGLQFKFGRYGYIQTAHVTSEQLLFVPGFGETKWIYLETTWEEIPLFKYSDENKFPISRFLDLEVDVNQPSTWWATPKGFPRKQYREVF